MSETHAVLRRLAVLLVTVALALVFLASVLYVPPFVPDSGPPGDAEPPVVADTPTVVFGAAGDFDNKAPDYPDMVALAKRLGNRGGMFLLALGDLGYVSDEQQWCGKIKGAFDNTLVVAGNHDTTESGPGDINTDVIYCPFNINSNPVPGPTYGYGKSYYFDYPQSSPLVRVLMITAGTSGTQVSGQNYATGGAEYTWAVNAVNGARASGIPWVVVGLHKMCITVGSKTSCEMGQAIFNKLVDLKVDLLLQGHDHVYERSKQLALSTNCPSVLSGGQFDPDCVVASGPSFEKGKGSIVVVDGAGGRDLYTVRIDGSDPEIGYFDAVMGTNVNTQGKANGHGTILVSLNSTGLRGTTTFCPLGTGDTTTGECPSLVGTTFSDTFTISSAAPPPVPLTVDFAFGPSNPSAGQVVTFTASASGGTAPYAYAWQFGDGVTGTGLTPTHAYAAAGSYVVNVTATDAAADTAQGSKTVVVIAPPPAGSPTASFAFSPTWPQVNAIVTFDASGSSDPTANATLQVRWDWTSDGTYDTVWSTARIATHTYATTGTYVARLEVRDDAGLTNSTTAPVSADGAAPTTAASPSGTLGQQGWYRSSVTVTLTATDDVSGVAGTWIRRDNASWVQGTSVTFTNDRVHTLDYYSKDRSGQTEITHTLVVPIDQAGPATSHTVQGTQDPNGSYIVSANVSLSAVDSLSGVASTSYRIDGGGWRGYANTIVVTAAGTHAVEFFSTDVAGNMEPVQSVSVPIAGSASPPAGGPPVTTLSVSGTSGSGGWYLSPVTVTLAAVSPDGLGLTIRYRLDNGSWRTYSAPFLVTDGAHTLDYNATDAASQEEAMHTAPLWVDGTPPATSASLAGTPGRDHWFISAVTVILSATDAMSGVASTSWRLDGGSWQLYASPFTVGDGRHLLEYRSTDVAGQRAAPVTASIKVDLGSPRLRVSPLSSPVTVSQVSLIWNATDDVSGVVQDDVSVDGGAFASLGLNATTTLSLTDGLHVIRVRAIDDAGNAAVAEVSLRVDTNLLSPTGPYGGVPLYLLVEAVVLLMAAFVWRRHSRKMRRERQRALRRERVRSR